MRRWLSHNVCVICVEQLSWIQFFTRFVFQISMYDWALVFTREDPNFLRKTRIFCYMGDGGTETDEEMDGMHWHRAEYSRIIVTEKRVISWPKLPWQTLFRTGNHGLRIRRQHVTILQFGNIDNGGWKWRSRYVLSQIDFSNRSSKTTGSKYIKIIVAKKKSRKWSKAMEREMDWVVEICLVPDATTAK